MEPSLPWDHWHLLAHVAHAPTETIDHVFTRACHYISRMNFFLPVWPLPIHFVLHELGVCWSSNSVLVADAVTPGGKQIGRWCQTLQTSLCSRFPQSHPRVQELGYPVPSGPKVRHPSCRRSPLTPGYLLPHLFSRETTARRQAKVPFLLFSCS